MAAPRTPKMLGEAMKEKKTMPPTQRVRLRSSTYRRSPSSRAIALLLSLSALFPLRCHLRQLFVERFSAQPLLFPPAPVLGLRQMRPRGRRHRQPDRRPLFFFFPFFLILVTRRSSPVGGQQ